MGTGYGPSVKEWMGQAPPKVDKGFLGMGWGPSLTSLSQRLDKSQQEHRKTEEYQQFLRDADHIPGGY